MVSGPEILILYGGLPEETVAALRASFTCHGPFEPSALDAFLASRGARVAGLATNGKTPLDARMLDRMPALRIVSCFSAGTDAIAIDELNGRGIALSTTSAALAEDVADLAIALATMARRRLVEADAHARRGTWLATSFPLGRSLSRCRLGVLGYGHIGKAVARRGVAMGMRVAYCARRVRTADPLAFHATPLSLAGNCDVLVIACPGGEPNRALVSDAVLAALGREGTLVNIARGEIMDQASLVARLSDGRLGSAGLDVLDGEPAVLPALARLQNVVLTPHIGSATTESRAAMGEMTVWSLRDFFSR